MVLSKEGRFNSIPFPIALGNPLRTLAHGFFFSKCEMSTSSAVRGRSEITPHQEPHRICCLGGIKTFSPRLSIFFGGESPNAMAQNFKHFLIRPVSEVPISERLVQDMVNLLETLFRGLPGPNSTPKLCFDAICLFPMDNTSCHCLPEWFPKHFGSAGSFGRCPLHTNL